MLSLFLSLSLSLSLGALSILVADNDDFCGLQSKASFTSTGNSVRVLIDKYSCTQQSSCMVSERRPGLLTPAPRASVAQRRRAFFIYLSSMRVTKHRRTGRKSSTLGMAIMIRGTKLHMYPR